MPPPPCRHRLDLLPNGNHRCTSEKLIAPRGVDDAICERCPFVDHEPGAMGRTAAAAAAAPTQAGPVAPPSLLQRGKNFARSVARHVAAGLPRVSDEVFKRRLAVCQGCDQYRGSQCNACGCVLMTAKLRFALESCPLGKWAAEK